MQHTNKAETYCIGIRHILIRRVIIECADPNIMTKQETHDAMDGFDSISFYVISISFHGTTSAGQCHVRFRNNHRYID